jgi:hypothetical protein
MQPVTGPDRPSITARRTALLHAAVGALAVALLVAAPAARAQSAGEAPAAAAFRGQHGADARPLDDQTLSHQRGGAVGMVMVAVAPQFTRNNGVTLWDEIAPPAAPLPIPIDASQQAAQGNIASYTRK